MIDAQADGRLEAEGGTGDATAPVEGAATGGANLPVPAPGAPVVPAPSPVISPTTGLQMPSTPAPVAALGTGGKRYRVRFAFMYGVLGAVIALAISALAVGVVSPAIHSSPPWSNWAPPSGSTAQVESAIVSHVASQYHLAKGGGQLVGVVAESPAVTSGTHKVTISAIAVRRTPNSDNGIAIYPTSNTWTDEFCGLGPACAISSGQATVQRGRLVRREALEVALYTFKFAPSVSSLVTFMPPPPGEVASTLLYFQKGNLSKQLSEPLDKTLPLLTPPLPTAPDKAEAATIDKLTLPAVYSYSLTQLQDGSAALVLAPLSQ
jgi:hypothetical protein